MTEADYRTTRILAGEMQSLSEYHAAKDVPFLREPNISDSHDAKTGTFYYDANLNEGFGDWNREKYPFRVYRVGYWKKWGGDYRDFSLLMVKGIDNKTIIFDIRFSYKKRMIRVDLWNPLTGALETVGYSYKLQSFLGNQLQWSHIGIVCNIYSGWVSLWHNGVKIEKWNITPVYPMSVFIATAWYAGSIRVDVDDAYFDYSNNDEADECPPNRRFYEALPNGAGIESQWTPSGAVNNYECVDEVGEPDDDTTYVNAPSNALLDMYEFTDVSIPADEMPKAAAIQVYCKSTTVREFNPFLKLAYKGTMNAAYGNLVQIYPRWLLNKTWDVVFDRFDVLPQGGEWTVSEFNGGQFGFESANIII